MPKTITIEKLFTYESLADYLDCSAITLRKKVMNKQIPYIKIGRAVRFKPEEIQTWIDTQSFKFDWIQ